MVADSDCWRSSWFSVSRLRTCSSRLHKNAQILSGFAFMTHCNTPACKAHATCRNKKCSWHLIDRVASSPSQASLVRCRPIRRQQQKETTPFLWCMHCVSVHTTHRRCVPAVLILHGSDVLLCLLQLLFPDPEQLLRLCRLLPRLLSSSPELRALLSPCSCPGLVSPRACPCPPCPLTPGSSPRRRALPRGACRPGGWPASGPAAPRRFQLWRRFISSALLSASIWGTPGPTARSQNVTHHQIVLLELHSQIAAPGSDLLSSILHALSSWTLCNELP